MTGRIAIFGYGPVGRATAARLFAQGSEVVVVQRRAPAELPRQAAFAPCDALDVEAVVRTVRGCGQFVVANGFPYSGVVWRDAWPRAIANFVAASKATGALMASPDSAFGQAWHAPCAPTRTTRDILKIAAEALGVRLRISAMPAWMLGASAMFSPFLRELIEMRFQWDRPYHVDASPFRRRLLAGRHAVRDRRPRDRACVPRRLEGGEALRAARGMCGFARDSTFTMRWAPYSATPATPQLRQLRKRVRKRW